MTDLWISSTLELKKPFVFLRKSLDFLVSMISWIRGLYDLLDQSYLFTDLLDQCSSLG